MSTVSERDAFDPECWVDDHGDALFRFAMVRVGRREIAEDLVQETFLAGLKSRDRFRGQSQERSWLIAILKHKTADWLNRRARERTQTMGAGGDAWVDSLFDERERWEVPPGHWGDRPETALECTEFWDVFSVCVQKLPARLSMVFQQREIEERSTEEICKELRLSPTNLWVMLHRARLRLRKCLDAHWFLRERER
ncbi:MAG: sigma-70 family RNA polymerase sigma factor [Planctomycetaceae bacterium]